MNMEFDYGHRQDSERSNTESAYRSFSDLEKNIAYGLLELNTIGSDGEWQMDRVPFTADRTDPINGFGFRHVLMGPDRTPDFLKQRMEFNYRAVYPLAGAAKNMIGAGLGRERLDTAYIKDRLANAMHPFGISVKNGQWDRGVNISPNPENLPRPYDIFLDRLKLKDAFLSLSRQVVNEGLEDVEPALTEHIIENSPKDPGGKFVPGAGWTGSPYILRYAEVANNARSLAGSAVLVEDINYDWPVAAPLVGKGISAEEYLRLRTACMGQAVLQVISDQLYPTPHTSRIDLKKFASMVGYAIHDCGLRLSC